jgi:DNA-binding CsgD family transcriptional regulator
MSVDLAGTRATGVREAVAALAADARDPLELLAEAAERVRTVVPFEGGAWLTCDPETVMPTGSVSFEDSRDLAEEFLRNELLEADLNKFADLHRRGIGAASLHDATAGQIELSPRVQRIHLAHGLGDELRICFRTPEGLWGGACMARATDAPPFSQEELVYAAAIGDELGRGLRRALAAQIRSEAMATGTGMLVLGPDGAIELSSGEADGWLASMPPNATGDLPLSIVAVALQAHAREARPELPPARARLRLSTGQWLLVHASVLRDAAGAPTRTAVVLEPAERSRIAGLLLTLYGLSGREREVAELLIRGLPTDEVAERLTISRHTVRDHVKAIFAKVGVSSRPELTALVTSDG